MQPASEALEAALADLAPKEESVPFFSTVTGRRHSGGECDAAHWGRGVRQPVQFASCGRCVWLTSAWIYGLRLARIPPCRFRFRNASSARGNKHPVIASARREREHESVLEAAMDLHRLCVPLDFAAMTPSRRLLSLPAYAWDKSRWWNESNDWREGRLGAGGRGLLDARLPRATPTWIARLDSRHMAFLKDHRVENHTIFPASAFVEIALEAGVQLFEGRPFIH